MLRRTIPTLAAAVVAGLVVALAPHVRPATVGAVAEQDEAGRWPVVNIEQEGGFVPQEALFTRVPDVLVSADGRHITPGPQILIFPGPILPNLRERALSPDAIAAIRALAAEAGLDEPPPDYGQPPVADATTTVVTYTDAEGRTTVHRAYALALNGGPEGDLVLPGLTPDQAAARARLADFIDALRDPEASLPAGSVGPDADYVAPAFRVRARAVPPGEPTTEPVEPPTSVQSWPLPRLPLAGASSCLPVTGTDADVLRPALAAADAGAHWTDAGVTYTLAVRPLLPGDTRC